jgi:hypothetical protein
LFLALLFWQPEMKPLTLKENTSTIVLISVS